MEGAGGLSSEVVLQLTWEERNLMLLGINMVQVRMYHSQVSKSKNLDIFLPSYSMATQNTISAAPKLLFIVPVHLIHNLYNTISPSYSAVSAPDSKASYESYHGQEQLRKSPLASKPTFSLFLTIHLPCANPSSYKTAILHRIRLFVEQNYTKSVMFAALIILLQS